MMKGLYSIGSVSLIVLVAAHASAVVIRDDKNDQLYKDFGSDARFASVGRIDYVTSSETGYGTANYIGKNSKGEKWILTASHVLAGGYTSANFVLGNKTYAVDTDSIQRISNYSYGKWDIGVAKLVDTDNTLNVKPARFSNTTFAIDSDLAKRRKAYAAGFGRTGTGLTGATTDDKNVKRGMVNTIDALNTTRSNGDVKYEGYMSDFDKNDKTNNKLDRVDFDIANWQAGQTSSRSWLDLEGQLAPGDSGGGLFTDFDGDYLMIGIASTVRAIDQGLTTTYGAFTTWAPLDLQMANKVTEWTGISGVPEPASIAILGVAIAGLASRRRRN